MATRKAAKKKALPASKNFGGRTYKKSSCTRLKSDAKKKAEGLRGKGKCARVLKNPTGGYCVFTSPKKK